MLRQHQPADRRVRGLLALIIFERPDLGIERRFSRIKQRGDPLRDLGRQSPDSTPSIREKRNGVPVVARRLAAQEHSHSRVACPGKALPVERALFRFAARDSHGPINGGSAPAEFCFVEAREHLLLSACRCADDVVHNT
jgi:hypothetical protein